MQELIDEMVEAHNELEENERWHLGDRQFLSECLADGNWSHEDFKHLEQEGGGEGGAEYCYTVWSWKDKIYKMEYSYMSHCVHDFDEAMNTIREVKEVEKLVKVYV